jgi:phosphomannomutase
VLIAKVKLMHADVAIAFDGDAERSGAVDDKGGLLYGHQVIIIYSRDLYDDVVAISKRGRIDSGSGHGSEIKMAGPCEPAY